MESRIKNLEECLRRNNDFFEKQERQIETLKAALSIKDNITDYTPINMLFVAGVKPPALKELGIKASWIWDVYNPEDIIKAYGIGTLILQGFTPCDLAEYVETAELAEHFSAYELLNCFDYDLLKDIVPLSELCDALNCKLKEKED